jgi:hypothetical protein
MIGPLSAKSSARSSLSAERFKRLLGLDSKPRTVAALLPRYAAETPFPEVWGGFRCSTCDRGGLTFDPTGRSPDGWADNSAIGVEPAGTFRRAVFRKTASAAPPWLAGHSP